MISGFPDFLPHERSPAAPPVADGSVSATGSAPIADRAAPAADDSASATNGPSSAVEDAAAVAWSQAASAGDALDTPPPAELYAELFGLAAARNTTVPSARRRGATGPGPIPPSSPGTLSASGLSRSLLCDLILKQLALHGSLAGVEIARNARLPFPVIDECLRFLKDDHCVEVSSGDVIGRVSYRFHLTDEGRRRAKEAFDDCRYVGPAPVPLDQYVEQCRRQTVTGIHCTPDALRDAFDGLAIPPGLLDELGPAVCSGRSIFLHGPPGNGKSQIARGLGRFLNDHGGEIYVPYAVQTEHSILTVFDPTLHRTTDDDEVRSLLGDVSDARTQADIGRLLHGNHPDMRWRRVRRPVVITGGELTLDLLDLRFNPHSRFYVAPLQIKANGGVFMIDDFGRQLVSPRELLNRWIVPLEERIDYLTLATGKKFPVPFEQLVIFSTNLDPRELADDAFLRRIRHRVRIGSPDRELFTEIFRQSCEQRAIPFEPRAVEFLYLNFYDRGRTPRSSDPRDLLEIVQSICRFRNQRLVLTQELMAEAAQRFFASL